MNDKVEISVSYIRALITKAKALKGPIEALTVKIGKGEVTTRDLFTTGLMSNLVGFISALDEEKR